MDPILSEASLEEYLSSAPPVVLPAVPSPSGNKKRRRGPVGVKWTLSKERQFLRLYELTGVKIEDIPVVMSDADLKFSKRHAQDKLSHYLGDRPVTFRPKDATEELERIVKNHALKEYLKLKGDVQYEMATGSIGPFQDSSTAKEDGVHETHQVDSRNLQPGELAELAPGTTGINAEEKLKLTPFSKDHVAFPPNRRTSMESLQSLQRRMASRSASNGHVLTQYSSVALQNIPFVKRRLSISSMASRCSMTTMSTTHSWEDWKRGSDLRPPRVLLPIQRNLVDLGEPGGAAGGSSRPLADWVNSRSGSRGSTKSKSCWHGHPCRHIVTPLEDPLTRLFRRFETVDEITMPMRVPLSTQIRRNKKRPREAINQLAWTYSMGDDYHAFFDVYRKAYDATAWDEIKVLEDLPDMAYLTMDVPMSPCGTSTLDCCQNLRRGHPRASKCRICRLAECIAHAFVRFAVLAWQNGDRAPINTKFASSGILLQDLFEVDMFHDTVLHTAARNGAPNAHALDAAGQTFMHVLNPVGFDAVYQDRMYQGQSHGQLVECGTIMGRYRGMSLPTTTEWVLGRETGTPSHQLQELFDQALMGSDPELWGGNALHSLAWHVSFRESEINQGTSTAPQKRKLKGDHGDEQREYILNLIRQLRRAGVDVNGYDRFGHTPIMAFVLRDLSASPTEWRAIADVLRLLITSGSCVHRRNRKGETALHVAMRLASYPAVEVLLASHANVHSRSGRGDSILQTATKVSVKAGQNDAGLYGRIVSCINLAIAYGAVEHPDVKLEWDEQEKCRQLSSPRPVVDSTGHRQ
ncbi:hypothetical protein BJ875DRAFT_524745 [Amylocarpus encephaloides]|uniref:Uncharacterized protein n=1 Tax=Amylocarpus encephaloides TaxID=45428 RepID=A0A9P7YN78_9HELO|nr:hypothetical protein BJ875DRAFT_524745 [Amylocarpus encephaloides]